MADQTLINPTNQNSIMFAQLDYIKTVQESAYKRAGSEERNPHIPLAKRSRMQRSLTPTFGQQGGSNDSSCDSRSMWMRGGEDSVEVVCADPQEKRRGGMA